MNLIELRKNTIGQGIENIKYRIEKNKNKKCKILSNYDFNVIAINIYIIEEELKKLIYIDKNKLITLEEQIERTERLKLK